MVIDVDHGSAYRFSRLVPVTENQTAQCLFATLPLGLAYAGRLVPAMATGLLVATIESVCILEMQPHLAPHETVVGTRVLVDHLAPALPGHDLRVHGAGQRQADGAIRFEVTVDDRHEQIARAEVRLAIVGIARFGHRLARKADVVSRLELCAA